MTPTIRKFARSTLVVSGAASIGYFLRFGRNVALARLLTQNDFGICVALAAIMLSVQSLTDFGFDKMMIQDRRSDDRALQSVLATLALLRAAVAAFLLLVLAPVFADLFGVPQAVNAFRLLSAAVFLQGFTHLDIARMQKDHRFGADAIVSLTLNGLDFVFAVAGVYFTRTYAVLPWAFIGSMMGGVAASHLLAERRYSLTWDRRLAVDAITFGGPLVLSGLILLLSSQADRIVVGASSGVALLAVYGVAMTIVSTPAWLAARILSSVSLPILAEASQDSQIFRRRFQQVGAAAISVAAGLFLPLMVFGDEIITLVFGRHYDPPPDLLWIIGIGQAAALLRCVPNVAALAFGDSKNLAISNLPRTVGIAMALVAVHFHGGVVLIAASFACGEFLSLASAAWHIAARRPGLLRALFPLFALLAAFFVLGALASHAFADDAGRAAIAAALLTSGFIGAAILVSSDVRKLLSAARAGLLHVVTRT